ncbi:MAG TPA: type VI secretion system-associated protein TagF, partial [Steroidobacteraceae bacterium]|nr:type VI secretion system-associated protein TagF [Steroidobacteraceae bacterium]
SRGDFLQRRVPQEFIDTWDAWLQQCMHSAKEVLREKWLDTYLTGPVWRFVLSSGVCGSGCYAGVMLPSVDRVGRCFPLALIAQLDVQDTPTDIACRAQHWFDAAEAVAINAVENTQLDVDAFDDRVEQLGPHLDQSASAECDWMYGLMQASDFPQRAAPWHVPLAGVHSMQRAMNVLAYRELARTLRPVALWWTEGSNPVGSCALVTRGLPPAQSFVAMLAGEWRGAGWASVDPNPEAHHMHSAAEAAAPEPSGGGDTVVMPGLTAAAGPLQVSTFHESLVRTSSRPEPGMRFVDRPEIGLWGVASADGADGGQAVADILQEVPAAADLSSLAESVRQSLERIQQSFYRNDDSARAIVFVTRDDECALVCAGDVQALRHSLGTTDFLHAGGAEPAPLPAASGNLMDLINGSAAPAPVKSRRVEVRYQTMRAGDYWLVSGGPLFEAAHLPQISAALATAATEASAAFANVRAACDAGQWPRHSALPLIVLRAAPVGA